MEKDNIKEQIDSKYLIEEKIGSGLSSKVFLVKEIISKKEYVAKVFKEKFQFLYYKEINILNKLKEKNNEYIIKFVNSGEGEVIRKNRETTKSKYCIFEYACYGKIYDFIYCKKTGFGELYGKVIFSKIMKGINFCHSLDICHRDIKLQNILFNCDFCPKICDFGFACINAPNLTDILGTESYIPPEIISKQSYDGKKADIFSLGVSLIILVTGKEGFETADVCDKKYNRIISKHFDLYWKMIESRLNGIKLSKEFKELYIKMVSYNPKMRPSAEEILNFNWFKEINEMSEVQMNELENKIRDELLKLSDSVQYNSKRIIKAKNIKSGKTDSSIKSFNMDELFFDFNLKPKYIEFQINMDNYIQIKGELDPVKFMNNLCSILIKEFGKDKTYIDAYKKKLKFDITFEEDKEKEEITNDIKEELIKLGIENEINVEEVNNELIIQIKLYEYSEGHILRFIHKKGNRKYFLDKFNSISKLIEMILS